MSIRACRKWAQTAGQCLTLLLLSSGVAVGQSEGLTIEPERSTSIAVSNRDINRIHCSAGLSDVLWSREKPVSVETDASNVFVKFMVKRVGERETATTTPVDLHVFCGGEVYTLILTPHPMDSVTLRLGNPLKKAALAINQEWGSLAIEDKIKKLTLAMYRDEIPSSFQLSPIPDARRATNLRAMRHSQLQLDGEDAWINVFTRGVRRVNAPGIGLMATEFEVQPQVFPLTFVEKDFLDRHFGEDIIAVTVHPLTVTQETRKTRVIVIERSIGGGR